MIKQLTTGSPNKILWRYATPMLVSVIFQQLYNIADSVIAGKCISDDALAAIGVSYPVTMIYMAFAVGSNIGCFVVISQLFGAGRYHRMKTAIFTSLISAAVLSVILSAMGILFCKTLLRLLNTPEEIMADSAAYLYIYTAGFIFVFMYNICTATFTALGDSLTPLIFLIASSIGNVVADLIFVLVLDMGVPGLAWATFISQGIAALLAYKVLLKKIYTIRTTKFVFFSTLMLRKIAKLAIPSILQQSFVSVGNLFIQGIINSYGATVIAGYSAAIKLNTFAVTLSATSSNSLSGFTAQNIGAGKIDRIGGGFKAGLTIALCVILPFVIGYSFFGDTIMQLFVNSGSTQVIDVGVRFLRIVAPFYLICIVKGASDGVLHGSAAILYFMAGTFTDLILRVILAYILPGALHIGVTGIWISWPIGWVISTAMAYYFYKSGKWKGVRI